MTKRCSHGPTLLLIPLLLGGCGVKRIDLLPLGDAPQGDRSASCSRDAGGDLVVQIGNHGRAAAQATTTVVEFESYWPVTLPTRPVAPGETSEVQLSIPCRQECRFQIIADALDEVDESNEENNRLSGICR